MKKVLLLMMVLALVLAMLLGCAKPAGQPGTATPQATTAPTATPSATPTTEPNAKIASKATDAQGKLNGWIDNNSVEIELNPEDILAFRVTEVKDQMTGIKDGDKIKFSYEANSDGQLVITKIEKLQ